MTHTQEEWQATELACERAQLLESTNKDFGAAIIYMSRELKETLIKEVQEGRMQVHHRIENITKEIEIIKTEDLTENQEIEVQNHSEKFTGEAQQ